MMFPGVRRSAAQLRCLLGGFGFDARPGTLLLVTGEGEWVLKQIATSLQEHLQGRYLRVEVLDLLGRRPYISRANIHCLCRPVFFGYEGIAQLHPTNRVVLSWLHGGRDSRDPSLVAACDQLERHWRKVQRFIVPNMTTRRNVLECGVNPDIVHVIPNGVDTKRFRPAPDASTRHRIRHTLGIAQEAFVVGSFQRDGDDDGHPKLIKGPDILVETLEKVHRRRPIVALLTGSGRTYVRRCLGERAVPYVYRWLSEPQELAGMYHAIDAYLISSREEGGPTALRESMASGVPVVSSRMGLAADLIRHGINGLLADVGDADGLADGILRLLNEPVLGMRLAGAALTQIGALDYAVIARRYQEEVYSEAFR